MLACALDLKPATCGTKAKSMPFPSWSLVSLGFADELGIALPNARATPPLVEVTNVHWPDKHHTSSILQLQGLWDETFVVSSCQPFPGCQSAPTLCPVGAPTHHTFLCLEVTAYPKIHILRLSTVSMFRFPVPPHPTGSLPLTFRVDHMVLEVQQLPLVQQKTSGAPMPMPQVDLFVFQPVSWEQLHP